MKRGWYKCKSGGRWAIRFVQDGRAYLCDPDAFVRRLTDERIRLENWLDLILMGPVSVYSEMALVLEVHGEPVETHDTAGAKKLGRWYWPKPAAAPPKPRATASGASLPADRLGC